MLDTYFLDILYYCIDSRVHARVGSSETRPLFLGVWTHDLHKSETDTFDPHRKFPEELGPGYLQKHRLKLKIP